MLRRRQLKKERVKGRKVKIFILFLFLIASSLLIAFLYSTFSFGRETYISPLPKNTVSKTQNLEKELEKANISYASVSEETGFITVKLKEGGVVILSSKKDIGSQLSSLQLILSRLTIEGKKLKTLDFRYDNPVVSF